MELALKLPGNTQITAPGEIQNVVNKTGSYGLNLFGVIIGIGFLTASIIALFFLIWGGIKWITSEGDPKSIQGARTTMIYAIIGLAIVFFSYGILNIIGAFLNINFFGSAAPSCGPGTGFGC